MLKFELASALPRDKRASVNGLVLDWNANACITHINLSHAVKDLPALYAGMDCRPIAPGQFYVVGELPESSDQAVTRTDQSHGAVLLCLQGETSEQVLSSLTGAELSIDAFARRPAIQTRVGHISVNLKRLPDAFPMPGGFSIIVPRSFVSSVWHDIEDAMRLFG